MNKEQTETPTGPDAMNKEQAETERYKMPLSPRAEEFIYQLAHKTELLEVENKKLRVVADDLLDERNEVENVAIKACEMIADTLGCCPYASTGNDEIAAILGCEDYCVTNKPSQDTYCWFKYLSLDLDETGDVEDES
jgi:peroxiredoxin family protein